MEQLLSAMRKIFPHLNKRPHTFEDVATAARKLKVSITVCPYSDKIMGYFCTEQIGRRIRQCIVINSKLNPTERLFVGLHEITHVVRHVPPSSTQWLYCYRNAKCTDEKHDFEANFIALIAMFPTASLFDDSIDPTLHPGLGDLLIRRWKIWQTYEK